MRQVPPELVLENLAPDAYCARLLPVAVEICYRFDLFWLSFVLTFIHADLTLAVNRC